MATNGGVAAAGQQDGRHLPSENDAATAAEAFPDPYWTISAACCSTLGENMT